MSKLSPLGRLQKQGVPPGFQLTDLLMPSCLPGHTTHRDEEHPMRGGTRSPTTPTSVKSVARPSTAAGTDWGLFSHLWPRGWSGNPQRGPGPPCLLLPVLRSHRNERLKRPFHRGTGKTCLYVFIISVFFLSQKVIVEFLQYVAFSDWLLYLVICV